MKLSKSLAVAVALALSTGAAQAAITGAYGTAAPSSLNGAILAVWDSTTNAGELVNLNFLYADATAAGALGPNAAGGPYVQAANPTGAAGNVYQIDFGTVPGFASVAGSSTNYAVLIKGTGNNFAFSYNSTTAPAIPKTNSANISSGITGPIGAWQLDPTVNTLGAAVDPTGLVTTAWQPTVGGVSGTFGAGTLNTPFNFSGSVGTSLYFYNAVYGAPTTYTTTAFGNAQGDGFWFLSSSGDLTYNVLAATTAVPLPAAAWLLISGIAGLGAFRRRRAA